ncbi:hypothetical protein NG798_23900 [Ancylothrix sp. C2]|nr:hypothetical protein [Ancylothrix sp. D3o]MCT7952849.1 hypothetical protein [Ancylothrix sp. D3o]
MTLVYLRQMTTFQLLGIQLVETFAAVRLY